MQDSLTHTRPEVAAHAQFVNAVLEESAKAVVGQRYMTERMLIALLTGGHLLIEGVPGLAKTLAVKTLAQICDVQFSRIQFTPDLLPSDLIGTLIFNPKAQDFEVRKGPIFAHFVLADEINRAPAKVQSALLEAMAERQVTIGDTTHTLPDPFLVLATQNPIEQEGTYPLPEAQMDRFIMKLSVKYPSRDEELQIIDRVAFTDPVQVDKKISHADILEARKWVREVYVDPKIKQYVIDIVFATRDPLTANLTSLASQIEIGASPRASIHLIQAAQGLAFINGRGFVTPEDIKLIGRDVLRHRILPSFEAEAEGVSADAIIDRIFSEIEVP